MVDDNQVRVFGALVHGGQETLLKFRALLAGAGVAPGVNTRPQFSIGRNHERRLADDVRRQTYRPRSAPSWR